MFIFVKMEISLNFNQFDEYVFLGQMFTRFYKKERILAMY